MTDETLTPPTDGAALPPVATTSIVAEAETVATEVVDWIEHEAALLEFEANKGLSWIKAKVRGEIVMLSRSGDTTQA